MKLAIKRKLSPNWDERPPGAKIQYVILHYTGMETADAAIERLCDPEAKVSAHYVIRRGGAIAQLVDEDKRAWHAGKSCWRGETGLNDTSIGIELVNRGHEWGYQTFPVPQIGSCMALVADIMSRHGVSAWNVLGHSDIAPDRKTDPGELFPWEKLAQKGIGLWFESDPKRGLPASIGPQEIGALLSKIGYDCPPDCSAEVLRLSLVAFQRHWRQASLTGEADTETIERLWALAAHQGA